MSCINKSSVIYQQLVDAYGDDIAEAAVRKMSAEKGLEDSFYIPSIEEVESLINASVPAAPSVKDAALMGSLVRVMNKEKKAAAEAGNLEDQRDWIREEVSEFYDALRNQDPDEIGEETIGLFRTAQQFPDVQDEIEPYLEDVFAALDSFSYDEQFAKWKQKKETKGQAKDVTSTSLRGYIDSLRQPKTSTTPEVERERPTELCQVTSKEVEKASKELDNYLLDFLKPFGVQSKEVEDLKNRLGEDALGVADVINKLITLSKNRKIDTVPEEAGHMIVMLMGQDHPDIKGLMNSINKWSGYKKVYDEYWDRYYNEKQIKIEAVGKVLAKALVSKFKEGAEDSSIFSKAQKVIEKFFAMLSKLNPFRSNFYTYHLADKIAINVLLGNKDYVANLTTSQSKLNYQKTIVENPFGKYIIDTFVNKFGLSLTGSLAIAGQGETIYRPETEPIHDLDFVVDDKQQMADIVKWLEASNALPIHYGIKGDDYTTLSYYLPKKGYTIQPTKVTDYGYVKEVMVKDEKGNLVEANADNAISVDFFVYDAPSGEKNIGSFKSVQDIYKGKLFLSPLKSGERFFQRPKDQKDYVLSVPTQRDTEIKEFIYLQEKGKVEPAVASPQVIRKVKEFLKRIGVDYNTVQKIVVNGKQFDANAVADFTRKIIEIVEGKEGVALPEEAMHFYVEILKQTNPKLLDSMLSKIAKYPIYKTVFDQYSNNPLYQTKEGKPDIRKLKEEAVAKKLADLLVFGAENDSLANNMEISTWWQRVLDWFRGLFQKAGFNPFEEAVKGFEEVEEGAATFITSEGQMFQFPEGEQPAEKRDKYFEKIKSTPIIKTEDGYNTINGKQITNRVTDFAKRFYDKIFGDRQITQTEREALINDTIREYGTAGHSDIENILYLLIDKESGFRRAEPLEDNNKPQTSRKVYNALKEHFEERIASFPAGTRFLLEAKVFDNKDTAGTMDFIAISAEGKVQILDWKFINLNTDAYEDVPWYKKKAWRIQLSQYKRILEQNYDIPAADIVRTSALPIKAHYDYVKDIDGSYDAVLTGISIGNVNVKTEERDYLLPVSLEQQSTGDDKLDRLIKKIQGLRESVEEESAKTPEERFAKKQQLNLIEQALRHLQEKESIVPLLDQAAEYLKSVDSLFETYENVLEEKDFNEVPLRELTDFGLKLNRAFDLIKIYTNLDNELSVMFKGELDKEQEQLETELSNIVREARKLSTNLEELTNKFGEKIANSVGVSNLMDPELQVSLNKRMFVETSRLQMKTLQAFFKKRQEAQNRMDFQTEEENRELLEVVKPKYDELAKRMGWNLKNYFDILTQKGSNKLIDQFEVDFYKTAKQKLKDKDYEWIKENVDIDAYKAKLAQNYESQVKYFEDKVYSGNAGEQRRKRKKDIDELKKKYDVSTEDSLGWFLHYHTLRGFPLVSKWESQEWKEMNKYPEARALYDWIIKTNEKADEAGYLPDDSSKRVFLPFVAKSFTEKIVFGGKIKLGEEFMRAITIDEEAVGYGQIDKVTNRLVNKIPRYFVTELDRELSQDLFRNLALYNESVNRYKELSDLEGLALALGRVERNKTSIQTSFWGKPNYDISKNQFDIIESNDKNADLYDRQIATLVYGQKYVQSEQFDQLLGKVGSSFEAINKKIGFKLLPENMSERQLSLNKSIDALNQFFQTKVLGFNPLSSISNLLGGSMNAIINSGKYFDKTDFVKSEFEISSNLLQGEYGKKVVAAMKYFLPFTENMNRDLLSELSLSKVNDESLQKLTFGFMRTADYIVQSSLFLSVLRNQILIDGQIVNARDYLRNQPEYKERYKDLTNLQEVEAGFEAKLEELISKHGLLDQIELKGENISIPGIDRNSKDVYKIRNVSKELSKNALGNLSPEEVRGIQQNIFSRSFMVFKNWIPSLVDVRFGELKYNSSVDAYEWGRYRTVARYLGTNSISSTLKLMAAVRMTPQTVEELSKLYEQKKKDYFLATGKKLEMTEQEFYDLVRENMRQAGVDAAMSLALLAMFFAVVALKPDPDDDEDKYISNMHKFAVRALDKISDELTFFYSPGSFQQILNGSIFPSLGVFTDAVNVVNHMLKEFYGMSFDEKLEEKNHVIKYMLKPIPLVSQLSSYLPLYAPDLAKDLGIEISKESRMK